MSTFWRVFIINGCWILSKAFSASIEMIIWFLSFNLLIWCITLIDLHILKNPCIPLINPTWSWCIILFKYCWDWFDNVLLRIFLYLCSYGILIYSFNIFLCMYVLHKSNTDLVKWVRKCFFFFSIGEVCV